MATPSSASKKAAAARRAAAELRAKQRARARRVTIFLSLAAMALVAVFAVAIMFIVQAGEESGPYAVPNSGELRVPALADETDGILIGPGGVAGGAPSADAVRLDLFEDPLCPVCTYFVQMNDAEIRDLVDQGDVDFYYHPVSILDVYSAGTHYSTRMTNAWITTAEYDPDHFWLFVELSYANAPEENTKGLTNDEIADLARQAGVSEETIGKFADGEFTQWVVQATDRASEKHKRLDPSTGRELFGTPTFMIAGVYFDYWSTQGNITAGVNYVKANGAAAFADYLANPPEPSPSPSPSI